MGDVPTVPFCDRRTEWRWVLWRVRDRSKTDTTWDPDERPTVNEGPSLDLGHPGYTVGTKLSSRLVRYYPVGVGMNSLVVRGFGFRSVVSDAPRHPS